MEDVPSKICGVWPLYRENPPTKGSSETKRVVPTIESYVRLSVARIGVPSERVDIITRDTPPTPSPLCLQSPFKSSLLLNMEREIEVVS